MKVKTQARINLLKKAMAYETLSFKQLFTIAWWEIFRPVRAEKFYLNLLNGMAAKYAFENTVRYFSLIDVLNSVKKETK